MKLTGQDVITAAREAVGIRPDCPVRAVQIDTPLHGVATLTVEMILTADMLKLIGALVANQTIVGGSAEDYE